jgi:uncharacterized protein (TIGR02246 family)
MRHLATVVTLLISLSTASALHAQTKNDAETVRELPQAFCAAFNNHDGHQLAQIMAEDVDFVTVGATWLHGRGDFDKYHSRLLGGRFNGVKIAPLQVAVRFLRPDIAVVHWSWTASGDRNPDGTPRQRRYGLMTMVAEKRQDKWLVVVSQNDNSFPGIPPEFEGITSPMPIPDQVGTQPPNR